jgi:hypothetical protein
MPTREANDKQRSAWHNKIGNCMGRKLTSSSREGRAPGEWFAHQRWEEFYPKEYFQTTQVGARTNKGLRDSLQMHKYQYGEFGPGGLYHRTAGGSKTDGTTNGVRVKIHPKMPLQDSNAVWTFDGTFPPKLLMARYGSPILFRHR